ncbi:MAG TPA: C4-dicarboxylate ABC transporter [Gammaproteobacteria bacterium]|nr:C4-dicarboxylate ABC transporter [Gammaproteobacteria bacterium]
MNSQPRLPYFPVSFFSMIMGLSGFTLVMMKVEELGLIAYAPVELSAALTIALFLVLISTYTLKLIRHPDAVRTELDHPAMLSFFPTITISLILIGSFLATWIPTIALLSWQIGAAGQLLLALLILTRWIHHDHFEIHHISPAWFIPVIGNILVPLAGVENASMELNWFFFSTGLLFWIVLFTIIMYRMVFHHPMAENLLPTMFIMIAPPAVGFISYLNLVPDLDNFARVLYYNALFMTLLLLVQTPRFMKIPFSLSWWVYSFPLTAVTVATLLMYEETGKFYFLIISYLLLALVTTLILFLLYKTFLAARHNQICIPSKS